MVEHVQAVLLLLVVRHVVAGLAEAVGMVSPAIRVCKAEHAGGDGGCAGGKLSGACVRRRAVVPLVKLLVNQAAVPLVKLLVNQAGGKFGLYGCHVVPRKRNESLTPHLASLLCLITCEALPFTP